MVSPSHGDSPRTPGYGTNCGAPSATGQCADRTSDESSETANLCIPTNVGLRFFHECRCRYGNGVPQLEDVGQDELDVRTSLDAARLANVNNSPSHGHTLIDDDLPTHDDRFGQARQKLIPSLIFGRTESVDQEDTDRRALGYSYERGGAGSDTSPAPETGGAVSWSPSNPGSSEPVGGNGGAARWTGGAGVPGFVGAPGA